MAAISLKDVASLREVVRASHRHPLAQVPGGQALRGLRRVPDREITHRVTSEEIAASRAMSARPAPIKVRLHDLQGLLLGVSGKT